MVFNALVVSDIGENPVEQSHRASVGGRNIAADLIQKREQTHCLHGYRLSAGVGTCKDNGLDSRWDCKVNGHAFGPQKRMSGMDEIAAVVACNRRFPYSSPAAVVASCP